MLAISRIVALKVRALESISTISSPAFKRRTCSILCASVPADLYDASDRLSRLRRRTGARRVTPGETRPSRVRRTLRSSMTSPPACAYSSSASRCCRFILVGTTTCTVTWWSPRCEPRTLGIPKPRKRSREPDCVPAGSATSTSPSSDGTSIVAPSATVRKTHRHVDERIATLATEERVRRDAQIHVEIARGSALRAGLAVGGDANPRAVVDACGNVHGEVRFAFALAMAVAGLAGRRDDMAFAAAARARGLRDDLPERGLPRRAHRSRAAAAIAGQRSSCRVSRRSLYRFRTARGG